MRSFFANNHLRRIASFSVPIILGQLGTVLLGLTDTIMLGQFGKTELAAVGIANQVFFLITVIGMGIMTALTPIVSSSRGAENKKECGEFLRSGIELSFIISCVVFCILMFISFNFHIFRQPEVVNEIAGSYLKILSVSVFPMLLFLALKHFNDGIKITKPAMYITFFGVLLNVFFNWIFIYGNLTFPALGAEGAGIATLLVRLVMGLLLVVVIFYSSSAKQYLPPLISTYNTIPVIKKLLKIGFPAGMQIFFEVGAYAGATIVAGWVSLTAMAAHQIGMGIIAFCYMIATGLAVSGSVHVAQAFGKGDQKLIKQNGVVTIKLSVVIMTATSLLLIVFKNKVIGLFTHDVLVAKEIGKIFIVLIAFQFFNGLQAIGLGILRGLEEVRLPAIVTLLSYWLIGVPFLYFLAINYHKELGGIWYGLLLALLIGSLSLVSRFFYLLKNGKAKKYTATTLETA